MSQNPRFSFLAALLAALLVLAAVAGLNYLVDPLWYAHGNLLTGRNLALNERISKVNLLDRTIDQDYDCLILGSSRVTMLRASRFEPMKCFNFALKGAQVAEELAYARYARDAGMRPKVVYVGVDDFNFVERQQTQSRQDPVVTGTPSHWHAFFSVDVLMFSLMTLADVSSDINYYDRQYDQQPRHTLPPWKPVLADKENQACTDAPVEKFKAITEVFPEARMVGFQPMISPWNTLVEVHSRQLLDCTLENLHAVSEHYDEFLDFAYPNELTRDNRKTTDGSHFTPDTLDAMASRLQGKGPDIALDVKALGLEAYREEVRKRLRAFAIEEGQEALWNAK